MKVELGLDTPEDGFDVKFQRSRDGTINALVRGSNKNAEAINLGYPETILRTLLLRRIQSRIWQAAGAGVGLAVTGDGLVHYWKGINNSNLTEAAMGFGIMFAGWFTGSRIWDDATVNMERLKAIGEKFSPKS